MFPCGGLGSPGTSARGPDGLRLMGSISEGPMLESRAGGFGASRGEPCRGSRTCVPGRQ